MGHRLSKIYTRTGDKGTTGLGDGSRVDKDGLWVEAYGTVDELNSFIGVILSYDLPEEVSTCLSAVQHDLFDVGGELCIPNYKIITDAYITRLENQLDAFNADLPMLKDFILPAGTPSVAHCHVARTVCRRAERRVVTLMREAEINTQTVAYLNRLSDLLFVIARVLIRAEGKTEVLWEKGKSNQAE